MCVAIFKPGDQDISEERLRACWDHNKDGAGFMYPKDGKVVICKGYFLWESFITAYRKAIAENPGVPFGIHFRITTHGLTDKENAHPHRIFDSMAMIHNGIINVKVAHDSKYSDTHIFANHVMRGLPTNFEKFDGIVWLLEVFLGKSNKIVVLKGDGSHYILNEKEGVWDNGVWYSNYSFRSYAKATATTTSVYRDGKWEETSFQWGPGAWRGWWYAGRFYDSQEEAQQARDAHNERFNNDNKSGDTSGASAESKYLDAYERYKRDKEKEKEKEEKGGSPSLIYQCEECHKHITRYEADHYFWYCKECWKEIEDYNEKYFKEQLLDDEDMASSGPTLDPDDEPTQELEIQEVTQQVINSILATNLQRTDEDSIS